MKGVGGVVRSCVRLAGLALLAAAGCATVSIAPGPSGVNVAFDSERAQPSELSVLRASFAHSLQEAGLVPDEDANTGMRNAWRTLMSGQNAVEPSETADVAVQAERYLGADMSAVDDGARRIARDARGLAAIVLDVNTACDAIGAAQTPASEREMEQHVADAESVLTTGLKARDLLLAALEMVNDDASDTELRNAAGAVAALSDALAILGGRADRLAYATDDVVG